VDRNNLTFFAFLNLLLKVHATIRIQPFSPSDFLAFARLHLVNKRMSSPKCQQLCGISSTHSNNLSGIEQNGMII